MACGSRSNRKNKEHPFPQWLIKRTQTNKTSIRWIKDSRVPAHQATLPLCQQCNTDFGKVLEQPMRQILHDVERGRGLSDFDAEIIVRWLWKIDGLLWHVGNPSHRYSATKSLRDRVLKPLDEIRGHLVLAMALCKNVEPGYGDSPMGIDSGNSDGIFVSGVFSKTAMMVVLEQFVHLIPHRFSTLRLSPKRDEPLSKAKLFYPSMAYATDTDLVAATWEHSQVLTAAHVANAVALHKRAD